MTRKLATGLLLALAVVTLIVAYWLPPRIGHPVTPFMESAADDAGGKPVDPLPGVAMDRPTVVVFILPGCECSEAYDVFMRRLFDAYGDRVAFAGVVVGDARSADEWKAKHQTPYPLVADPDLAITRAYGAARSAYTALVVDGRVSRLWPGYSAEMLRALGVKLAEIGDRPEASLDVRGAPEGMTSGCPLDP
ncbi:peroxiredoxin family protein [Fimbriiglobus ruber]|uniref:Redoxin domain-containing protein n=1 Tax=Fimbriiglobus ruber TaxID=1908690 RepID=A0A225DZI4_9BACT|nr:redoxin family protein [Fimbriiglobus ruber]OWK41775.1 hypothetical protein FRUB_03853 [Fimbriiglobus ruber]